MSTPTTPRPQPLWLTIPDLCAELDVARRTLYDWWSTGRGPRRAKLPNGSIRVRADWLEDFLLDCEDGTSA